MNLESQLKNSLDPDRMQRLLRNIGALLNPQTSSTLISESKPANEIFTLPSDPMEGPIFRNVPLTLAEVKFANQNYARLLKSKGLWDAYKNKWNLQSESEGPAHVMERIQFADGEINQRVQQQVMQPSGTYVPVPNNRTSEYEEDQSLIKNLVYKIYKTSF